jgi:hypothetical protein
VVEAVDFTGVFEPFAVAQNPLFELQYRLLFRPFELLIARPFVGPKPCAKSSLQDDIEAGSRMMNFGHTRAGAKSLL